HPRSLIVSSSRGGFCTHVPENPGAMEVSGNMGVISADSPNSPNSPDSPDSPRDRPHQPHRMRRLLLVGLLAIVSVLGFSVSPALAHAELLSTDPPAGSVLDAAPDVVTLTFSEPIVISLGAVRLFDGRGNSIDIGAAEHPGGTSAQVQVDIPSLTNGSYVVDWRVVSDDGHPIHSAFTFQVGSTSNLQAGILDQIIGSDHTGRPAGIGLAISRGVVIAAMAVVFGGLVVIAFGIVDPSRRIRIALIASSIAGMVFGLIQLPLEVGYATGRSLSVLFDGDAWRTAGDSRIGTGWVVRALIIGMAGLGLTFTVARRSAMWWKVATVIATLAVGVASAYGGHGAAGRWVPVAIGATALHVGGMAVWLGGLVMLLLGLGTAGISGVRRFSNLALAMIGVVIVSGVVQSFRQLGSWTALTSTSYGTLLIWKVALVMLLLAVASLSRKLVQGRLIRAERSDAGAVADPDPDSVADPDGAAGDDAAAVVTDVARLRRAIAIEVVIALVIVVTTSLLMASNPSAASAGKPFSTQLIDGDYLASITVDPGRVGSNEMHIYLSDAASSLNQPDDVTVAISDPSRDVAPIQIAISRSGAGHFTAYEATFPYAAKWTLTVTARYNDFDDVSFTAVVPIG
ncbi:MAG: copper resistance protein CopC, partial [Ilumatobacteraceae bacterium]